MSPNKQRHQIELNVGQFATLEAEALRLGLCKRNRNGVSVHDTGSVSFLLQYIAQLIETGEIVIPAPNCE